MHDKLFVVDGQSLITGDRNTGGAYYGLSDRPYVSRDVLVDGKSAADASDYIEKMIQSGDVARYQPGKHTPEELAQANGQIDRYERTLAAGSLKSARTWQPRWVPVDSANFFTFTMSPGRKTTLGL